MCGPRSESISENRKPFKDEKKSFLFHFKSSSCSEILNVCPDVFGYVGKDQCRFQNLW